MHPERHTASGADGTNGARSTYGASPGDVVDRLAAGEHDLVERTGELLARALRPLGRTGLLRDILSGTPSGHAAHPAIVVWPLGMWLSASVLDIAGRRWAAAARTLVGAGVAGAAPAALTGASDWLDTSGAERRLGVLHAASTAAATVLQVTSFAIRGRHRGVGVALSGTAIAAAAAGGWLGGHLAYRWGVGVNTTAFQSGPEQWREVASMEELRADARLAVRTDAVALLLTLDGGTVAAIEDRCTHRGGPLHEGEQRDGCAVCPWHGSRFDIASGAVRRGPATTPQAAYETTVRDGRVFVRRREAGSLRSNPRASETGLPLRSS